MEHTKKDEYEKLDLFYLLHDLGKQFRHLWWLVLLLAVLGGGLMFLRSYRSYRPMYECEAIFSANANYDNTADVLSFNYYYDNEAAQYASENFPYILNSDVMTERLQLALGPGGINGSISTSSIPGTNFMVLTVRSTNPDDACSIAEAVIDIYPQIISSVMGSIQLSISTPPAMPTAPYNSFTWHRPVALGVMAGIALGMAILIFLSLINQTIMAANDVKKLLNLSCLAEIPNVAVKRRTKQEAAPLLLSTQEADSSFSEAFRLLRLKLLRQLKPEDQVILFTSSMPSEGKSSVAINAGLSLAKDGKRVLLIDGDLRAQNAKHILGLTKESLGLQDYLDSSTNELRFLRVEDASLYLLASDNTCDNPTPLFNYELLHRMMEILRSKFDYILIDTPPAAMMADAAALSRHADQVIYIIRQDYATKPQLLDGIQSISGSGTPISGFILNRVKAHGTSYHGYGYGYGYHYGNKYGYGSHYGKYGYSSHYSEAAHSSSEADG